MHGLFYAMATSHINAANFLKNVFEDKHKKIDCCFGFVKFCGASTLRQPSPSAWVLFRAGGGGGGRVMLPLISLGDPSWRKICDFGTF